MNLTDVWMQNPKAPVVGRRVHFWMEHARPQHVRDEEQPVLADIVFVHASGDVSVHGYDHYGSAFTEHAVPVKEPTGKEKHGGERITCTWLPGTK
jgi:hypothetical protein